MGAEDNRAKMQAFNDAYNARNPAAAAALCVPDVEILNVATGEVFRGADGVAQFFGGWATAFPDSIVEVKSVCADENGGAVEFIGRGTHTGVLSGPGGEIPATGRKTEIPFIAFSEMRDGKVTRIRLYFDSMTMLRQLGLVPAPAEVRAGGSGA